MRTLAIVLFLGLTSAFSQTIVGPHPKVLTPVVASGTTYYLSPTGSDSNSGTDAGHPWLSPNHSVACGDVILAAAGNYDSANFWNAKWGAVSCPAKNNVAWLKCATAFACKIRSPDVEPRDTTPRAGMFISASFWGVQGWEVTTSATANPCFNIAPAYYGPFGTIQIDHIILANNIANGCTGDGFNSGNGFGTSVGTDYVAYLGNIAYNTGTLFCAAGLSFWAPVASDTLPGTHYYMAGNFAWNNHSNCGDAEGIIFDTWDGVAAGKTPIPYAQQGVAENNLTVFNDGPGMEIDLNASGARNVHAHEYFFHNTSAYNCRGPSSADYCAEIVVGTTVNSVSSYNLAVAPTRYAFGGGSVTHYGSAGVSAPSNTNQISNEFAYSPFGTGVGLVNSAGFVLGPGNITGTDPVLANPVMPPAPSCGGYATTTACMATVIANFAPTNGAASGYGYQQPSTTPNSNPYYPQWLCTVTNLPSGLVTPGCA